MGTIAISALETVTQPDILFVISDGFRSMLLVVSLLIVSAMFQKENPDGTKDSDTPWTARDAWKTNVLSHKTSFKLSPLIGGLLFFIVGIFLILKLGMSEGPVPILIGSAFSLCGFFIIAGSWKSYRQRLRFRTSEAELETMPGRLGERFLAQVRARIDRDEFPEHGAQVQLSCYRRTARYKLDKNSTAKTKNRKVKAKEHYHLLWRGEKQMRAMKFDSGGAHIPISFEVPDDFPESTAKKRSTKHLARTGQSDIVWEVAVRAEVSGIDYEARFEVPVYEPEGHDTAEHMQRSSEEASHSKDASSERVFWNLKEDQEALRVATGEKEDASDDPYAEYVVAPSFDEPISKNVSLESIGTDGLRVTVKADRSFKSFFLAGCTGLAGMFLVALGLFFFAAGLPGFTIPFLIGIVPFSFGLLMMIAVWFMLMQKTVVTIADGEVDLRISAGGGKDQFLATDVKAIDVDISGSNYHTSNYHIIVRKRSSGEGVDNESFKGAMGVMGSVFGLEEMERAHDTLSDLQSQSAAITDLHNKQEADWIAQQMRDAVNVQARYS